MTHVSIRRQTPIVICCNLTDLVTPGVLFCVLVLGTFIFVLGTELCDLRATHVHVTKRVETCIYATQKVNNTLS